MKGKARTFWSVVSVVAWLVCVVSCSNGGDTGVNAPELTDPCVSWCRTVAPWSHDGNPYESENYTVYSDGASLEARTQLAVFAEEVMAQVKGAG